MRGSRMRMAIAQRLGMTIEDRIRGRARSPAIDAARRARGAAWRADWAAVVRSRRRRPSATFRVAWRMSGASTSINNKTIKQYNNINN